LTIHHHTWPATAGRDVEAGEGQGAKTELKVMETYKTKQKIVTNMLCV